MFEAITIFYKYMPEELKKIMKEADPQQVKELENMMYVDDNKVLDDPAVIGKMLDNIRRGLEALPFIFDSVDKYKGIKDLNALTGEQKIELINEFKEQLNAIVVIHKTSVEFGKMADKWIPTKDQKDIMADFIRKHKDEIMKEDKDEKD